jgi:hypothetical protein
MEPENLESKKLEPEKLETKSLEPENLEPKSLESKKSGPKRSGRRKSKIEIASMARTYTETVINMLASMVTREDVSPTARINAGRALLDRGWGKPLQKVELEGDRPLGITEIFYYIVDPKDPESPIRLLRTSSLALPEPEASEATLVPEAGQTETS